MTPVLLDGSMFYVLRSFKAELWEVRDVFMCTVAMRRRKEAAAKICLRPLEKMYKQIHVMITLPKIDIT